MLNELELQRRRQEIEDAWSEQQKHQYEQIESRFYKEKRGRRMELINPWRTLKERNEVEQKGHDLYWHFHRLQMDFYKQTGETVPVTLHYRSVETPNGLRYERKVG